MGIKGIEIPIIIQNDTWTPRALNYLIEDSGDLESLMINGYIGIVDAINKGNTNKARRLYDYIVSINLNERYEKWQIARILQRWKCPSVDVELTQEQLEILLGLASFGFVTPNSPEIVRTYYEL